MANVSDFNRSKSSSRATLLNHDSQRVVKVSGLSDEFSNGESSLQRDISALSLSKRLANSVSLNLVKKKDKLKKKCIQGVYQSQESSQTMCSSSGLISRYLRGGGCRVGACEEFDLSFRKKSNVSDDCMLHRLASGVEIINVECFSNGTTGLFQKKTSKKAKDVETNVCEPEPVFRFSVPDEVIEMILIRLPLKSLLAARRVCKKWRFLTTTPHFMRLRLEGSHQSPWLFLFSIASDRSYHGEMHALDVSQDQWHRISDDVLKNRFMFSVASIGTEIYIVGGCSSSVHSDLPLNDYSYKEHKGVLVFNSLTGLWRKATAMNSARLKPILGVFHVSANCSLFYEKINLSSNLHLKSRAGMVSDVYEDPHRFSLRCQLSGSLNEAHHSPEMNRETSTLTREKSNNQLKFALIVVGGHRIPRDGSLYHPLETGEVYDPETNRWIEIARLPRDFGTVCSGAVCDAKFYVYSENDKLAVYDLEMGFWVTIQMSQPPPRLQEYKLNLVSCKGRLYMLCVSWCGTEGQMNRREKAVRKLWEFDLWYHTWSEVSRHPDAPMDRNATFVVDGDKIYGLEMFKIFGQLLDFLTVCCISDPEPQWGRLSRKHALSEADSISFLTKTMLVLQL
ncbi:hypothetical protein J5N97_023705 [Dioscorea zingiberensis]|uniref:F-box domain-containing protein n=1 Tax=Dioscorea zingiberensis TaxID=325984 RepID=A0A9D5C5K3_9LILI|nr:hypothetical protein J5N97_023705 [Dioscorea zingiberensis]